MMVAAVGRGEDWREREEERDRASGSQVASSPPPPPFAPPDPQVSCVFWVYSAAALCGVVLTWAFIPDVDAVARAKHVEGEERVPELTTREAERVPLVGNAIRRVAANVEHGDAAVF